MHFIIFILSWFAICGGQTVQNQANLTNSLHTGLTERIGNFSVELLYYTSGTRDDGQNFIMSPITVWSVLAVISEGAAGDTRRQIASAIRSPPKKSGLTRSSFKDITQWLKADTETVKLGKINSIFVDKDSEVLADFQNISRTYYETDFIPVDLTNIDQTTNTINQVISNFTHGMIPKIVEPSYFSDRQMVLTSAVYFKGEWTVPFNKSSTTPMPFYDNNGKKIGDVNMMYNRYTYPFANMRKLQARVIELPYGKENRLSMLVMLPNTGVSVDDMFKNFINVNLDDLFKELKRSIEEYSEDEVDCYIPRFKIESDINLTEILKNQFNITNLFDSTKAELVRMTRKFLYVTKVVHKAQIEVTEEGTTASAVTVAEFSNRIGAVQFMANRPFAYIIVERVTNSIVFGGTYKHPSLY